MLFSAELPLVACLCAEIKFRRKIPEKIREKVLDRKIAEARRGTQGAHQGPCATLGRGPGPTRARGWRRPLGRRLPMPLRLYFYSRPKNEDLRRKFPETLPSSAATKNPNPGDRNSVLAPCRDGDSEEIVAIVITNASPSTIHVSSIHE